MARESGTSVATDNADDGVSGGADGIVFTVTCAPSRFSSRGRPL